MSWRFHLAELPSMSWVTRDLPLKNVQVDECLSAPGMITGALSLGYEIRPRRWHHLLVAECDGVVRAAGPVDFVDPDGDDLIVEARGFSGYPTGLPWAGDDYAGIQVDPLDIVRRIWAHVQSFPDGDLGVTVDELKTPVRVGEEERDVNFTTEDGDDVSFTTGPFRLAIWQTDDLGKVLDELARDTPFAYRERFGWSEDREHLDLHLELGYPEIRVRKPRLHFEVGLNVTAIPPAEWSEEISEVQVLGAGEGSAKPRATLPVRKATPQLRRVHRVEDRSAQSNIAAQRVAEPYAKHFSTEQTKISELVVADHPAAPVSAFGPGDEIRVRGDAGWVHLDHWVRIDRATTDVDSGLVTLGVTTV